MDIQETFAKNLRQHRKQARLSQAQLAELAHLHRTYIGGIEQGRINVSLKNIGKIADALEIDPTLLFLPNGSASKSGDVQDSSASASSGALSLEEASADTPSHTLTAASSTADVAAIPTGTASSEAATPDGPSGYTLCTWRDGRMTARPVEVAHEDLTIQILCNLIREGFTGDDLASRYAETHREILSFLKAR